MELLLIRHAEPRRIEQSEGPADPPLTEAGRRQAAKLADWLRAEPIEAVWASPLRRAAQTAAPLAEALGLEPVIEDELCEWDRDSDTYIPIEQLRAEGDWRWFALVEGRWDEFASVDPITFRRRVVGAMERLVQARPGERVAVVSHGGVLNAYLGHVLGIDRPLWFEPAYTSISRVAASPAHDIRSIITLNETPHLRS